MLEAKVVVMTDNVIKYKKLKNSLSIDDGDISNHYATYINKEIFAINKLNQRIKKIKNSNAVAEEIKTATLNVALLKDCNIGGLDRIDCSFKKSQVLIVMQAKFNIHKELYHSLLFKYNSLDLSNVSKKDAKNVEEGKVLLNSIKMELNQIARDGKEAMKIETAPFIIITTAKKYLEDGLRNAFGNEYHEHSPVLKEALEKFYKYFNEEGGSLDGFEVGLFRFFFELDEYFGFKNTSVFDAYPSGHKAQSSAIALYQLHRNLKEMCNYHHDR